MMTNIFQRTERRGYRRLFVAGLALTPLLWLGCGPAESVAPRPPIITDAAEIFWAVTLNHGGITLATTAPYDTLRLVATPRDGLGRAMETLQIDSLWFTTSNPAGVEVSSDGLLRAVGPVNGVTITARVKAAGVTRNVAVRVNVVNTTTPPVLASLSIQPIAPDSAKAGIGGNKQLVARATDANGSPISGIAVDFTSSDPAVATINSSGRITGQTLGVVTVIATATAYGVTKADTLAFTIGLPVFRIVTIDFAAPHPFSPSLDTLGVGGTVLWINRSPEPVDIVFENPAAVAEGTQFCPCTSGGNIAPINRNRFAPRGFPTPGRYAYTSTATGQSGVIVVVAEQ